MRKPEFPGPLTLLVTLLLAGCGGAPETVNVGDDDPALSAALAGQIMIDPDLVGQNRANSAAAMPPRNGALPTVDRSPEMIAAARAGATSLVGGPGRVRKAPEPREAHRALPPGSALTAAARAAASPSGAGDCAERARYTMQWAARLPEAFPVYPRGAVQEAAGTDEGGCSLRVVNFVTPVPLDEVMNFYFTRATGGGFSTDHVLQDGEHVLSGIKGDASYVVYARRLPSGNTEIDLLTAG